MRFKKGDTLAFDSGRQLLVKEVKEGGMGVVYICRKSKYGTGDWIFKTFKDEIFEKNKNIYTAFINECKTWIALSRHPFIVEAKSIESISGQPFVEMGKIYKWNLNEVMPIYKLPDRILPAIRIALEICLAMSYANRKIAGFVHRDLKPSNIMIGWSLPLSHLYSSDQKMIFRNPAFKQAWGQAAVSDFGLSKVAMEIQEDIVAQSVGEIRNKAVQFSKFGTVCGTPPYMSPEQCLGMPLDQRSDIYAFGCVAYEMLTGRMVYNARTAEEFIQHHVRSLPINIRHVNAKVPDEIANIIMRCLNKDPNKRFSRFTDICDLLSNFLNFDEKIGKVYKDIFAEALIRYPNEQHVTSEIYKLIESAYKLFQLGENSDAKRNLERAKNLYPARIGIYYFQLVRFCFPISAGRDQKILQKIKDYVGLKDEIESLKKVIEIDPEYAPLPWSPYDQLYDRYETMGKTEEVFDTLQRWLAVDKNNPKLYMFLGNYSWQKNNIDEAIEYFKRGESLFKKEDKNYSYSRRCGGRLSDLYFSIGKEELAIDLLKKHEYYRALIEIYFDRNELSLSHQYFEKHLDKDHKSYKYNQYRDDNGDENFNIDDIIRTIDSQTYIRDMGFGFQYSKYAFALEKENLLNEADKIYNAILAKYLSVPPTKNKPSKKNHFRKHLPLMIKILEHRISMLENKLKDFKVVLLVVNGPSKGHAFILKKMNEILIGRDSEMHVRISSDTFVSRKHARITFEGHSYFLEDLNSTNGTFIGDKQIKNKIEISPGSIITIGHTQLRFDIK